MLRASRPLLRLAPRASSTGSAARTPLRIFSLALQPRLPLPPLGLPAARFASSSSSPPPPKQPIDRKHEKEVAQETIKPRPGDVSSGSSVRHVMEGFSSPGQDEAHLDEGLKHDIGIVKDTFRLSQVPRESHILGLAGTVPYLATSLSTVFLAWDLTKNVPTGNSFYDIILVDHETARHLLSVIEPLQLGYGAVIISFLGAIHWGLEYAEVKPSPERTRFRYGMGVAASVVAWPTLLMPLEYALTTQLMAFVALYFADARATARGWAPYWYGTYRLLLTGMVGIAIIMSLVGRATINEHHKLKDLRANMSQPGLSDTKTDWAKLEAEEKKRLKKEKEEAEKKAKKEEQAKKSAEKKNGSQDSDKGKDKQKGDEKKNDKQQEGEGSEKKDGKDGGRVEQKDGEKKNSKEAVGKEDGKQQENKKDSGKQDDGKDDGKDDKKDDQGSKGPDDEEGN